MSAYLPYDLIRTVHIEPTSKCNLLCPQCSRVHNGAVTPGMPLSDLSWQTLEPSFDREFCAKLEHVYFCGNHGDPLASSELLTIIENLRSRGVRKISVFTNGSLRDPKYFRELATLLGSRGKVVFAIDGLEDTNHIYRVGAVWAKLETNVRAFIEAGGTARWDYLKFAHNSHQVDSARELAKKWGFKEFRPKSTTQFVDAPVAREGRSVLPITTHNRRTGEKHTVEPESTSIQIAEQVREVAREYGTFDQYVENTDIKCKTRPEGNIYIDFTGRVWPCCWIGSGRFHPDRSMPSRQDHDALNEKYGLEFNRLDINRSLADILDHPFFNNDLVRSWIKSNKRLWACGFTCGAKFEASTGALSSIENLKSNGDQ